MDSSGWFWCPNPDCFSVPDVTFTCPGLPYLWVSLGAGPSWGSIWSCSKWGWMILWTRWLYTEVEVRFFTHTLLFTSQWRFANFRILCIMEEWHVDYWAQLDFKQAHYITSIPQYFFELLFKYLGRLLPSQSFYIKKLFTSQWRFANFRIFCIIGEWNGDYWAQLDNN